MCVGRNKCDDSFYNFFVGIYTKGNKENRTQTKHAQNTKRKTRNWSQYSAQKAAFWSVGVPGDVPGSDSVDSQLHGRRSGRSHSTTTNFWPATWPSEHLVCLTNSTDSHVLWRTAFIAAKSRGQPCRFHWSSVQVTHASTRCGSLLAAACGQVS